MSGHQACHILPGPYLVSQIQAYHFGGYHNKDYSILGSILESPYLGKLPFMSCFLWGIPRLVDIGSLARLHVKSVDLQTGG